MGLIRFKKELVFVGYDHDYWWQLRPVRYSTLGRAETIKLAAQDSGITESQLEQAFDAFAHEIEQLLCNGHSLDLGELGKLYLNIKAKAVQSAENVSAELIKYCHLMLTSTKQFKEEMKQIKHIIEPVPDFYITRRCPFNVVAPLVGGSSPMDHVSIVNGGLHVDEPLTIDQVRSMRLNGTIEPVLDDYGDGNYGVSFPIDSNRNVKFTFNGKEGTMVTEDWPTTGADFFVTGIGTAKGL